MEMADGDRFTPEQAEALSALRDGRNVFLSGNAGTGKSYVLNAFISDLKARNVDFLALAPTGIAALNLTDGSTIHRTLKIAPGVCAPDGPKGSRKVLDAAKVIIIDEISMCRIDLFDHVMGMISQSMTRNGAKQVVLVGDFFQLPPVVTERDSALLMKFYPGNLQGWCFKSRYWTGFDFEPHVLKTVVRQSDPDFIDNLNRARVGDASCLDYFNAHSKSSRAYLPKDTLVLCANNRIADSINRENVDALDAPKVEFAAAATGTVSNGDKMAPERIVLCRGARVMSLVNSPQEGYVNGTQGTVTDASADAVTVKFDGVDEKVRIERHRWEINKSEAVVEMDDEGRPVNRVKTAVVGAYTQIPLKLAYAITIHKSQGLTFDACCVHTKVFAEGQLYVGLSRVRSAAGLTVFPKIEPNRLIASREVVEFYDSLEHRMEEPVQIECPRRFESQVRAYIRYLMDGRDPDAPTPPALEGALENSKGGTPEPGTERPARTLEEKIGADIVARATFALKFAVSGAMSKDHLEAKMLLAGYVLDWGRAPHELYVVCKEGGYRVSASELGIRRSEIEARIAKNSGFDLGSARRQPSPSDSRPGKRKGSAKESAGRTRNTRKANKR